MRPATARLVVVMSSCLSKRSISVTSVGNHSKLAQQSKKNVGNDHHIPSGKQTVKHIAIENGDFVRCIVDLPIKTGDFPSFFLCLSEDIATSPQVTIGPPPNQRTSPGDHCA